MQSMILTMQLILSTDLLLLRSGNTPHVTWFGRCWVLLLVNTFFCYLILLSSSSRSLTSNILLDKAVVMDML
jgi:hypothetical protein